MISISYRTACNIITGTSYTASLTCSIGGTTDSSPLCSGWSEGDIDYFLRMDPDSPFYMDTSIPITTDTWKRWRLKAKIHAFRAKWGKDPYTGYILTTAERICEVALADMWACWLK